MAIVNGWSMMRYAIKFTKNIYLTEYYVVHDTK